MAIEVFEIEELINEIFKKFGQFLCRKEGLEVLNGVLLLGINGMPIFNQCSLFIKRKRSKEIIVVTNKYCYI